MVTATQPAATSPSPARCTSPTAAPRARQAAFTRRTLDVSRAPGEERGSHVLGYADTEAHARFGTPDEVCDGLAALRPAGVDYVLVNLAGGAGQLRRFAREVMG
jgi:hypothetical protein